MKILLLGALTEGAGRMAGGLAPALARLGHDVRVMVPAEARAPAAVKARLEARYYVPHVEGDQAARAWTWSQAGVTHYRIAGPRTAHNGDADGAGRGSVFFSLAALGLCRALRWPPDVVHACDPVAGPAVFWLAADGRYDALLAATATVFTFGELAGPHLEAGPELQAYGLPASDSPLLPHWARRSPLGLGLAYADALAAGSPRQAREVLAAEFGHGWQGLFQARRSRLTGILGGLDLDEWDPRQDAHLAARYDAAHLDRRSLNKAALQEMLRLPRQPRTPLIGMISRGEAQPSFDIAVPALRKLLAEAVAQVVVVGPAAPGADAGLQRLERDLPGTVRLGPHPDERLVHRLYAGADVLLCPRRDDPDGATAMTALRYGAVPVVRAAGACGEVAIDAATPRRGDAFVFADYNSAALLAAVRSALRAYRRTGRWRVLQRRGMRQAAHFTWARAARSYLALYQQAPAWRKESVISVTPPLADDLAHPEGRARPSGRSPQAARASARAPRDQADYQELP